MAMQVTTKPSTPDPRALVVPPSVPPSDAASERSRAALRFELRQATPLPPEAIERLVRYAEFARIARDGEICASDARTRHVRFTMHGVAKLVCRLSEGRDQIVRFFGARRFLCVPLAEAARGYRAVVVAHEETHVALVRYEDFREALSILGARAARVYSWGFRERVHHACDVAALLRMPLRERLIWCLRHLATTLPDPAYDGPGISIGTRITRDDLADLAGASRTATSRAMARFRDTGLLLSSSSAHIVVAPALMQTDARRLLAVLAGKEKIA
jgi:CRP-like cAMP-binding protein